MDKVTYKTIEKKYGTYSIYTDDKELINAINYNKFTWNLLNIFIYLLIIIVPILGVLIIASSFRCPFSWIAIGIIASLIVITVILAFVYLWLSIKSHSLKKAFENSSKYKKQHTNILKRESDRKQKALIKTATELYTIYATLESQILSKNEKLHLIKKYMKE